jgi:hypothetical protein
VDLDFAVVRPDAPVFRSVDDRSYDVSQATISRLPNLHHAVTVEWRPKPAAVEQRPVPTTVEVSIPH